MAATERRKTPVQRRSAATVDAILEAAARILERDGLDGYRTSDVAELAGVSVGSLYQYFPNRDAITAALIERSHEATVAGLCALLAASEGAPLEATLDRMIDGVLGQHLERPRLTRMLELEEERLPKTDAVCALEAEIDRLNRELVARHADPRRSVDEVRTAASDVVCILRGFLDGATTIPGYDVAGLKPRLKRTLLAYLAPLGAA